MMLYSEDCQKIEDYSNPNTLTDGEQEIVLAYLQGMVDLWCTVCGDKPFSARDLIGGENSDWTGTPLMGAWHGRYNRYKQDYPNETDEILNEWTHAQSAKDIGHLLKRVLIKHQKFRFKQIKGFTNSYQFKGLEDSYQ